MALTDVENLVVPSRAIPQPSRNQPGRPGLRLLTETQSADALRYLQDATADQPQGGTDNRTAAKVDVDATEALAILGRLVEATIPTVSGRPNVVLGIEDDDVLVGTDRSPEGELVPIVD